MQVRKFRKSAHFDIMLDWLTEHNSYLPSESETPRIGYIVYKNELPIAIAFLRQVEGGFAQLDGLVTNPSASSKQRHLGIDCLVTKILKTARSFGIKCVMAYSVNENTLLRSRSHGFVPLAHSIIAIDLTDKQSMC